MSCKETCGSGLDRLRLLSFDQVMPQSFASLPMFPLPDVVLFPGLLLPLHIFEPRYRSMTQDALAGTKQLVVGRILEGPPNEYGLPPVASVMGVGKIVQHQALEDGRFVLLVAGQARARIFEAPFEPPYRRVRAELLPTGPGGVSDAACAGLVSVATHVIGQLRAEAPQMTTDIPRHMDAAALADWCAAQLLVDGGDRQAILDTADPALRVQRCTELLAAQVALSLASVPPEPWA